MKQIVLILILLFQLSGFSQAKLQGKVHYTTFVDLKKMDSLLNVSQKNQKFENKKMFKNTKNVLGVLMFSQKESLYKVENKMVLEKKGINLTNILAGGNSIYYQSNKEHFSKSPDFDEELLIEMEKREWQITQESKKIGNFITYKAICKSCKNKKGTTVAWFAPQLPVSFGPKDFYGLPGLILQVTVNNTLTTKATKIILTDKISKIKKPKGRLITQKEYKEFSKNFFKNLRK